MDLKIQDEKVAASDVSSDGQPPLDITALTRQMVKGDEMAYRVFYDAYFERLRRYLLVATAGDEHATQEALQSAMVRVVRNIKEFQDEQVLWGWLTVLARSSFIDLTRKRKRYGSFLQRFTRQVEPEQPTPERAPEDGDVEKSLDAALADLPMEDRELVEAKYLHGRSVRELAANAGNSEKAIESRLVRIRRKLKAALLERLKHG